MTDVATSSGERSLIVLMQKRRARRRLVCIRRETYSHAWEWTYLLIYVLGGSLSHGQETSLAKSTSSCWIQLLSAVMACRGANGLRRTGELISFLGVAFAKSWTFNVLVPELTVPLATVLSGTWESERLTGNWTSGSISTCRELSSQYLTSICHAILVSFAPALLALPKRHRYELELSP